MTVTRTRIDLNLVRVFVTIYETKSVTAAAERLFLTQPSVSYALARLRIALQDPLFVRGADGMTPTMCGELTYKKFSEAIASIDSAVELTKRFDPNTSSQRFRLAMSDIGELIFLPPILRLLQREAPNVELEVVQVGGQRSSGMAGGRKGGCGNRQSAGPDERGKKHQTFLGALRVPAAQGTQHDRRNTQP
jgi:DNA-binding transcriptional LysR family regulator